MKKNNKIGIIGGLGAETSSKLCLNINNRVRNLTKNQPNIILENLPVSIKRERDAINGERIEEIFGLLKDSISNFNKLDVDFIIIPCNTVHIFIDKLRKKSKIPIISIIEECANECKRLGVSKVGLLATKRSVIEGLHKKELNKKNISVINPPKRDQEFISKLIIRILENKTTKRDKKELNEIINQLIDLKKVDAILFGCTDMQNFIGKGILSCKVIDSLSILEDFSVKRLCESKV